MTLGRSRRHVKRADGKKVLAAPPEVCSPRCGRKVSAVGKGEA